jgi:hypothetical protein
VWLGDSRGIVRSLRERREEMEALIEVVLVWVMGAGG